MAVQTHTFTDSFHQEMGERVHDLTNDTLRLALYSSLATINQDTTTYSTDNELATALGYTQGGAALTLSSGYPLLGDQVCSWKYDTVQWTSATFTTRYGLIYNASRANEVICVFDWGSSRTPTNVFEVELLDGGKPLIKWGAG